jgi:hypothetical protein
MTPNTRHGFSAMCAGRGAEVERVLHHHESFAVAPRLDDVDASQHTPARAIRGGRSPGPRTTATTPGPRGLSTSAMPSAALATSTSWYGGLPRQLGALVDFRLPEPVFGPGDRQRRALVCAL